METVESSVECISITVDSKLYNILEEIENQHQSESDASDLSDDYLEELLKRFPFILTPVSRKILRMPTMNLSLMAPSSRVPCLLYNLPSVMVYLLKYLASSFTYSLVICLNQPDLQRVYTY